MSEETIQNKFYFKTASEIKKALLSGDISAKEIIDETYKRIDNVDDKLNAFISLTKESAYKTAEEVDKKIKIKEDLPPLAGIPISIKDNICMEQTKTTAASKILENFISPYNATVVDKLRKNLIPIVGKTNLDSFAMGSSTETGFFGPTQNPWDIKKVPGGSSGGSAAAVSAGESVIALGSDTGGSVRMPASFCGVVGMKPTYGMVSRYGLIAFASSLDQIGPFARCVEDAALILQAISGHDPKDSTSINLEVPDYTAKIKEDIKGLRVGVISEMMGEGINQEVKNSINASIKAFEGLGAKIEEISIPHVKYAVSCYYIIAMAEASSNLARFDGVKYGYRTPEADNLLDMYCKTRAEGFGEEVKRRIMLGTYSLSSGYYDAYYKKAQQIRSLIKKDFDKAFEEIDILISPTCPTTAFEQGTKTDDPLSMYLMDICTLMVNLSGLPGINIPCGFDSNGLPIGLQLIGPALSEELLLKAAYNFESITNFHEKHPEL